MERILVSACLIGEKVRYDGNAKLIQHPLWEKWLEEGRLISVCPEVSGGMSIPRVPAEILGIDGSDVLTGQALVVDKSGRNVTSAFKQGANKALSIVLQYNIRVAVLMDGSPSCGTRVIYDGTFSGNKKSGEGVTAALLKEHGVQVFSHQELEGVEMLIQQLELSPDMD